MQKLQTNQVTVQLLNGKTIQRVVKQYNDAYYVNHLERVIPITRDKVIGGKQTYKEVTCWKDAI